MINNILYSKTLDNIEKYKDINLCQTTDICKQNEQKMHHIKVLSKNLAIVYNHKVIVGKFKPCFVGAKIFDLSRLAIDKMYNNRLKPMSIN